MARNPGKRIQIRPGLKHGEPDQISRRWRVVFLDHLAESSNVTASAAKAGISVSRVYKVRREETEFARQWLAALAEGYLHLELEVVRRLREGDFKAGEDGKFDFANAIRLLAAHRDNAARGASQVRDVSAAEVRASIDRKIDDIRRRIARQKAAAERQGQ
ncbi:hypothetical protein [Erythrobacter donghaensis]|uniref:hypothetical protein n=1 Tax=Erythrobacter donghaensis TaxID=267135 RepID=UPI0009BF5A4F|nr:hypothetical protein [Erythrobacter donghaensis]